MNARFAECCRETHLELSSLEQDISVASARDDRPQSSHLTNCAQDIYVGLFFDGTNNNKYRDTPSFSQTNVARLYEVYPGTPAAQSPPNLKPRVNPDETKTPREPFKDVQFKAGSVPDESYHYYRKIYIPGNGTPMPDVSDSGAFVDRFLGLGFAYKGEDRIAWALQQLVNQVHAAIFKQPISPTIEVTKLHGSDYLAAELEKLTGQLRRNLALRGKLPELRKIRLSVFGFSRGSALARAFATLVSTWFGGALAGIKLQIDFLGLFDCVASIGPSPGVPHAVVRAFEGRFGWGSPDFMSIPEGVKRCVHLLSAHEVRVSFPVDSVCKAGRLPHNCKEIVYPGVHSDVGGGYAPGEQGRAAGIGADGDARKISQIALAQMYREARMAGVPLAPESYMDKNRRDAFNIHPQLRDDFNAYVEATRSGRLDPSDGLDDEQSAKMYPTETQPRDLIERVIWRHYAIILRWRRDLLKKAGGIAGLTEVQSADGVAKYQDIEDLRGAEQELRQELDAFRRKSASKSKTSDWNAVIKKGWDDTDSPSIQKTAAKLFSVHVHDSRAWFKPSITNTAGMTFAPNDEDWFVLGERESWKKHRVDFLKGWATDGLNREPQRTRAELELLKQPGQPLIYGGREAFEDFGYLRHRTIYVSGTLMARSWEERQQVLEDNEQRRMKLASGKRQIDVENARHNDAIERIATYPRNLVDAGRRYSDEQAAEIRSATDRQNVSELRKHKEILEQIAQNTGAREDIATR